MRTKTQLYRLPDKTIAYLEINTPGQVLKDKGLNNAGDAQRFHTSNVLRRIKRYMPFKSGMTYKVTVIQTSIRVPEIVTNVPYGKYLYYGKVMVDSVTGKGPFYIEDVGFRFRKGAKLRATDRDLEYTTDKNHEAGAYWDKALSAGEGKAMAADLQRYINRKG